MNLRRPHAGEWVAGAAAVALVASLFLPWFRRSVTICPGPLCDETLSGWEALARTDVALSVAAALGLGLVVATATQRTDAIPVATAALATLAGVVSVVLVVRRLVDEPGVLGAWVGLAGALGLVGGAVAAMRDERPRGAPRPVAARRLPTPPEGGASGDDRPARPGDSRAEAEPAR